MRILLTNDDGLYSDGLKILWNHLVKLGEVSVIVPETEKSAVAHAINIFSPLKIRHLDIEGGFKAFVVNGTPVDCVKIGVSSILKEKPDLLVSGINPGANIGMDVLYSGTVSAAAEGAILGIPSIAVSVDASGDFEFDSAASVTSRIIRGLSRMKMPKDTMLNINVPNCKADRIRGIKVTYQSESRFEEEYEERSDPRGNSYFWLKGIFKEVDGENGSDAEAVRNCFVSVTPLHLNLTDRDFRNTMKKDKFEEIGF
jgi:5'-nucleotidase